MFSLFFFVTQALAGILKVEILDVGQGDAILIRSPKGKVVLIDGGTGRGNSVLNELKTRSIAEVNLMIATHPHADHIGGLDEVLEAIPVKNYMDNSLPHTTQSYQRVMKLIEDKEVGYIEAKNGRKINLDDGIVLEILHPQEKGLTGTRSDLNSKRGGAAQARTDHLLARSRVADLHAVPAAQWAAVQLDDVVLRRRRLPSPAPRL